MPSASTEEHLPCFPLQPLPCLDWASSVIVGNLGTSIKAVGWGILVRHRYVTGTSPVRLCPRPAFRSTTYPPQHMPISHDA
jgi:hypothetical protein